MIGFIPSAHGHVSYSARATLAQEIEGSEDRSHSQASTTTHTQRVMPLMSQVGDVGKISAEVCKSVAGVWPESSTRSASGEAGQVLYGRQPRRQDAHRDLGYY
jgi:hypothetical protein